jgi:hypothetical protein
MKTNELRIGNLLYHEEDIIKSAYTVEAILKDSVLVKQDNEEIKIGLLQPIPLTEEWLLKFSFRNKVKESEYYIVIDKLSVSNGLFICYDIVDKSCSIGQLRHFSHQFGEYKYVHQLQNLYFTLTNEELIYNHS